MVDAVFKIGDFILVNKLLNSFGDEVTVRSDDVKTTIGYYCNNLWKDSELAHYNNYIFKCIRVIYGSDNLVVRIIEKDTMKETKYTITCHKAYLEMDKKRNRTDTIDNFLNS